MNEETLTGPEEREGEESMTWTGVARPANDTAPVGTPGDPGGNETSSDDPTQPRRLHRYSPASDVARHMRAINATFKLEGSSV